jgi:hypothetical protein
VSQGNYVDANDVRHRQTDGNTFGGVMSVVGNTSMLQFPDYTAANKKFRIFLDLTDFYDTAVGSVNFTWKLQEDGSAFIGTASNTATFIASLATFANTVYTTIDGLVGYTTVGAFAFTPTKTVGGVVYAGYFDMEFTGNTVDYTLWVENTVSNAATIYVTREWVPAAADQSFKVVGSQQLDEKLFVFLASVTKSSGIISLLSEVGVVHSTDNGVTFTYNRLVRSKNLGFSTDRRIEASLEQNGGVVDFYWTDGNAKPRAMYLTSSLYATPDAFLVAAGGRYDLETIDEESSFFYKVPSAYFDNIQVVEGGGNISAGNKRYTGRFLTQDFVPTDFLYPTNPLNIYSALTSKPYKIKGDPAGTLTNKSVNLTIKNITPGIYKYFELIAIEYVDETFTTNIVQRFDLQADAVELNVRHTNIGQDNILLGNNELLAITSKYLAAQTMKVFDNRMTISNLTEQIDYDLNTWAQSIKHSLETKQITGLGVIKDTDLRKNDLQYSYGEYIDPLNTLNSTSYMMNDTYRFGVQVQWKNTGKWSSPYWVDDIRFDTLSYNVTDNPATPLTWRRTANNLNSNLTDVTTTLVNAYYVNFGNVNLNYAIGGSYLRDLISSFRFVRAERIPEVLATGYFIPGCNTAIEPTYVYPYYRQYNTVSSLLEQYPEYRTSGNTPIASNDKSEFLYFYSPDQKLQQFNYSFSTNDELRILGVPKTNLTITENNTSVIANGAFVEYGGHFVSAATPYLRIARTGTPITLDEHSPLAIGELKSFATATNLFNGAQDSSRNFQTYNDKGRVFKLSAKLRNTGTPNFSGLYAETAGIYYGQIFRDLGANKKYPANKEITQYQSIGHFYNLIAGQTGILNNISVGGGDVFNQKTHYQMRWGATTSSQWGAMISFYSQNVANSQMMYTVDDDGTPTGAGHLFPQYNNPLSTSATFIGPTTSGSTANAGTIGAGLFDVINQSLNRSNQYNYNKSYNYEDNTILETGYNSDIIYDGSLPSRIAWSAKKVIGSQKDNYRVFKPLDFADLDLTSGAIVHHEIVDNNFYTWQPYSVQRQYFRDASLIGAQEGTDVVVGSGSILGSRGQELTTIGMSKKWSHAKGKTPTGKETFYWYNDKLQKFVRFGQDGTRVISDKGMISYLTNNGKYVSNQDYPLTGLGVHGVWNDKYGEAIFTFKYNDGASNKQFTVVYDEIKNGFVAFHSYYPNIYLRFKNTFFSPNPALPKALYLHDRGSESTYYGTYVTPSLTSVMNYDPNVSKNFEALQFVTDTQPFDVYLTTTNHVSYLDETEFEKREDIWYSPIKNDSTSTGLNNGDTSRLWGKWLKVKMTFEASSGKQKLLNMMVKFRTMARLYNQ